MFDSQHSTRGWVTGEHGCTSPHVEAVPACRALLHVYTQHVKCRVITIMWTSADMLKHQHDSLQLGIPFQTAFTAGMSVYIPVMLHHRSSGTHSVFPYGSVIALQGDVI